MLHRSEIRSLLRHANASAALSAEALDEALQSIYEAEERMQLPDWMKTPPPELQKMLGTRQVTAVLLWLCTSSREITELFGRYAALNNQMGAAEWHKFQLTEQLPPQDDRAAQHELEAQPTATKRDVSFDVHSEAQTDVALSLQQFSLQLLTPKNDAVAPLDHAAPAGDLNQPIAHYWTACTHKCAV